jgi:hypothetical protein
MKTFIFSIDFIDNYTGQFRNMVKEYRAKDYPTAKKGINSYLETNKTINSVLSCIFVKEV